LFLHAFGQPKLLRRLLTALEVAEVAFDGDNPVERDWALDEGRAVLAGIYATLETTRSPELAAHLESMCDECLSALGEAYAGRPGGLPAAAAFVRAMRIAMAEAPRSKEAA
jgi:hypothetical protein